jgi:glycosyltransferase involved in cell wall biosynthesis
MDLVTFLITTYNSERWIEECLNSVLNQTYKNLQILIIDDGSEDNTIDRIKKISDDRIELICKKHSGISKSLNSAIDKIKGEFVARLDSDDLCSLERISKQLKFLNDNKLYGIVGTNFILVNESGKLIDKIRNPEKNVDIIDQLPRRCCIWNGSVLMRREIIDRLNGYDERLTTGEDWGFFLRAIGLTKFYNIQEFLSTKRTHSSSISETRSALNATKEILINYNNSLIENSKIKKSIAKAYFNIGYYYYYENNFDIANQYFKQAIEKGGLNLQYLRYRIFSKYFNAFIKFYRKYRLYKLFDWLRHFDNANKYLRSKF